MRRGGFNAFSMIAITLMSVILISCLFGIVYLRSNFLTMEYNLSELENKKMNCLTERKTLLAEKTSLLSFANLQGDFSRQGGYVLPDRVKVRYISKQGRFLPYKASLEKKQLTEP